MNPKAKSNDTDVLVIGAGPAGSLASGILAQRGYNVRCLERSHFPRYSIGESLLPRCNDLLRQANMLGAIEARGYMVKPGATFWWNGAASRFRFADALPGDEPSTFQVPRADFDQTLATEARRHGAEVLFGRQVERVDFDDDGATIVATDLEGGEPETHRARFVLDCSGYAHVLPRLLGLEKPAGLASRTATFTMVEGDARAVAESPGDLWICIEPDVGWFWMIPFSDGRTSVGLVSASDAAPTETPPRTLLQRFVETNPQARARLEGAVPVMQTMQLRAWSSAATQLYGPRWAIAGNSGDFLDPVFSSGVALAFESASRAASLIDRELAGGRADWEADYAAPLGRAVSVFRAFVDSWYRGELRQIFFAERQSENVRRAITSVLAGYVVEPRSSLVRNPEGAIRALARAIGAGGEPSLDEVTS